MPRSSPSHCHVQLHLVPANFLPGPSGCAFGELADPCKAFVNQSDGSIGQGKEMAAGLETAIP